MISELEAEAIVLKAADDLKIVPPKVRFKPFKISFMPVQFHADTVAVTPAAREVLSPEALRFAALHCLAVSAHRARYSLVRQVGVMMLAFLASLAVLTSLTDPSTIIFFFGSIFLTLIVGHVAVASITSK